jgi:hypothetical protein
MRLITYRRYDIRLSLLARAVGRVFGGWRFLSFSWRWVDLPEGIRAYDIEVIWRDERTDLPAGTDQG